MRFTPYYIIIAIISTTYYLYQHNILPNISDFSSYYYVKIPTNDYCVIEKKALILQP